MKHLQTVILLIRLLLGIVFVTYGIVKLLGGQYYYGDFVIDSKTVGGPFFVWAFFGYSKIYALFTGVGEFTAGLLLLIPRTRTLGAAILFPVTLNITVMTFAFGFPGVKYASLVYTALCALLLLYDYPKLKLIFWENKKLEELVAYLESQPKQPPVKALNECVKQGWKREDLVLRRSSYPGGTGLNRQGYVLFEVKGSNPPKNVRVEVRRPHSFVDWQIIKIAEEAEAQR